MSKSGLQRRQPAASEPTVSIGTAEDPIYLAEDATQASQPDRTNQSSLYRDGISFEPTTATRAAKATKKAKSRTKSASTASTGSRKSQRLVELTERAAGDTDTAVSLPEVPTSNPVYNASYNPSTAGSSALTEVNSKIFNTYNPRKRQHTETESINIQFELQLRRNTRHSIKPTKPLSSL